MVEHVSLERIAPCHTEDVQRLASHPEVVATTNLPEPYPDDGAAQWIEYVMPRQEAGEEYAFAILNADDVFVGVSGLVDVKGEMAELGFWIGRPYWNRGYATEAGRKTLRFAFEKLDLKLLFARPLERNTASRRVVEKLGFECKQVETHENPKWVEGDQVVRYEMDRRRWQESV